MSDKRHPSENTLARAERIAYPETLLSGDVSVPQYPKYRVELGAPVRLGDLDPSQTGPYEKKNDVKDELSSLRSRLEDLQERLYAENRQSLLIVLQAMDTGGKDGTIKHVFGGVNPQGCRVWSFKQPGTEDLAHDFLWRYHQRSPEHGMIGIFNRSQYEDVLVVRVRKLVPPEIWEQRYDSINDFERLLVLNGTIILKFFLHISKGEQKKRFESRLANADKRWKFNPADLDDRKLWDEYQRAYEDAINRCSTAYAPWYVVPADHKWYRNLIVARTIADTLEAMDPKYPPDPDLPKGLEMPD